MITRTLVASGILALVAVTPVMAEEHYDPARLSAALKDVKMPLQDGIKASATKGKPISAKYEVEDGALQLSVYTAGGGKFYEVIVDHKTGKVTKSEEITKGDDLKAAKDQSAAMAKAKDSLAAAADKAAKANAGFRVVAVTPETKNGRAVADVTLLNGTNFKTVQQQVD
jgi:uncharacterized membrane protein YkoI